ncbi:hypothetical protein EOD42_02980 [Rhodovarius crocodyli]|uniref:Uncharacterized protein n=1 Tax=Rhodovarius crocodyli TaxID=1979269 RepID=A0A437MN71_9PROT|nr:hypothetical protein [Rhodovarius crocodyli]RVT99086.1 hypothetical protein EOD42_02980 [Rhodovarius crocodyli]
MREIVQGQTYHTPTSMAVQAVAERLEKVEVARAMRERASLEFDSPPPPRAMQRNAAVQLHMAGHIRTEQLRAAQEVERMFFISTSGVRGRIAASYTERTSGGQAGDDWSDATRIAYTERFKPWSDWAGRQVVRGRTYREITLMLCTDNLSPRQMRAQIGLHEVTILRHLQISLLEYAMIGGWVDPPMTEINLLDPSGVST